MAFTPGSRNNQMADINMTPMIDVMLVLLIIFMVAAPMLTTGIDVNLPKSKTGRNLESEALVVIVDRTGQIRMDGKALTEGALRRELKEKAEGGRKRPVMVQADHGIPYGQVIGVVDAIREAGFSQVGFVTQPGSTERGR